MNNWAKAFAVVTIAAAVGGALYGSKQVSKAREEQRAVERQQVLLSQQVKELQRERDADTNALAAVREELAAIKAQSNSVEILKLRGQISQLRQLLAVSEAKANAPIGGLSQLLKDPAMKEHIRQNCLMVTQMIYGDLFKELKLTPEQSQKAAKVMSDAMLAESEKLYALPQGSVGMDELKKIENGYLLDLQKELQPLLGDSGVVRVNQVREDIPAHVTVERLKSQLGANQLTDAQNEHLLQLVRGEPFDVTRGMAGMNELAFWGSQSDIDNHLQAVAASNQHIVEQASGFLTPEQVDALSAVLNNSVSGRLARANAFIQKPAQPGN